MKEIIKTDDIIALFPESNTEFKLIKEWCRHHFGKCSNFLTSKWYVCSYISINDSVYSPKHRCIVIRDKESFLITILTWHN